MALAASLGTPSSVPAIPEYGSGDNCLVERSTVNTGDCQQGGQECSNQCTSVPTQDCSAPAQPVCVTVTEEKCEIQYETVYEEVCEAGAAGGQQCRTVEEQVCSTVEEEQCSTVTEKVCETEYNTVTTQECGTEMETKCETEVRQCSAVTVYQCLLFQYMVKYEEQCRPVTEQQCTTVEEQQGCSASFPYFGSIKGNTIN